MGVHSVASTVAGGVTPICNECGISLCWDISDEEYVEQRAFWDRWICERCNGGKPMSLKQWPASPKPNTLIADLIAKSSIGEGLKNIRENGIEAELADLEKESHR